MIANEKKTDDWIEIWNACRKHGVNSPRFPDEYVDILFVDQVVSRTDQRGIHRSHDVGDERRSVGLDEDESGQTPNASHKAIWQAIRWVRNTCVNLNAVIDNLFLEITFPSRTLRQQIAKHVEILLSNEWGTTVIQQVWICVWKFYWRWSRLRWRMICVTSLQKI